MISWGLVSRMTRNCLSYLDEWDEELLLDEKTLFYDMLYFTMCTCVCPDLDGYRAPKMYRALRCFTIR